MPLLYEHSTVVMGVATVECCTISVVCGMVYSVWYVNSVWNGLYCMVWYILFGMVYTV